MKIFTYYQNIDFDSQLPILKLWEKSWKKQGFDAAILTPRDARQSPYYYGFLKKIRLIHKNITGYDISQYGISCYVRWLAYSTLKHTEPFLVSDYDVINKGFTAEDVKESEEKINFLDRYCPCLAYGTSLQFLDFCKDIITFSDENLEKLKKEYTAKERACYHDQEFLVLNHKLGNYNICPARSYVRLYEYKNSQMQKHCLFHIAHRTVEETRLKFPEFENLNAEYLRIKLITELLND